MQNESLMNSYLEALLEANKTTNLTRISSVEEAKVLHLEDSLVALDEINAAPEGLYADLGSGGGFPGVPLALATGRQTLLVDSVQKKMNIVGAILEDLNLSEHIDTYAGRIEDLARERPREFSVVTARALSKLSVLMELASPLLKKGGMLVCYKANIQPDEWEHALEMQDTLALQLKSDRTLLLSDGETQRRIVAFEKKGSPRIKLPRKVGMAQKKPL